LNTHRFVIAVLQISHVVVDSCVVLIDSFLEFYAVAVVLDINADC